MPDFTNVTVIKHSDMEFVTANQRKTILIFL